ncbi:TIP49-domain-containing protein [Armillaria solidipes]|uniref:RuvB-like helicase n=1 Tax=Armillaria solidipes TaxID=1076256 RepID=A0A2H3C530_9AGAR|nr:TIP49-domain-containing protein [Armillaria solidipes]
MFDALQRLGNLSARFSSVYSHIHRLRLDDRLEPRANSQEMVAWAKAREAAGMVLKTVQDGWIAGRVMLSSGSPSTGKTVIALGMAQTLGPDIPFTMIAASASEVFSLSMSKTEAYRRNIGIKEGTELVEGEVEIQLTGVWLELFDKMIDALSKEKVLSGGIVTTNIWKITELDCLFARSRDHDAIGADTECVQSPEDEIQKWGEVVHTVSLHDIDVINSRTQDFSPLFAGDTGEIKQEVWNQINTKVAEWREEGRAEIIPGVLFIDAVHMSDTERLSLLNRALENDLATLASNRGVAHIRGTIFRSSHGLPFNLDRVLIVSTKLHKDVALKVDATSVFTSMAMQTTLRYSLSLISCAQMLARKRKADQVGVEDLRRAYTYFLDEKRSVQREDSKLVVDYRQTFNATDIGYQAQIKCVTVMWNMAVEPEFTFLECKYSLKHIATGGNKNYYAMCSHSNKNISTFFSNTI